jgi:hypothetical protein
LQKDSSRRLRDIGDAITDLDVTDAVESTPPTAGSAPTSSARKVRWWVAAVVLTAAVSGVLGYFARAAPEGRLQKFHIAVQRDDGVIRYPAISPDGRRVVYAGASRLWVQSLDEWEPRELAGTEGAVRPFWSPGSDWIAYFRGEALLKVPATGGPVARVATLPAVQAPLGGNSGAWGEDGIITVSLASGPLLRVPNGGGTPSPFLQKLGDDIIDLHDVERLPNGALLAGVHRRNRTFVDAIGIVENDTLRIVLEIPSIRQPAYAPRGFWCSSA